MEKFIIFCYILHGVFVSLLGKTSSEIEFIVSNDYAECEVPTVNAHFDCMPDYNSSQSERDCIARGCCWKPNFNEKVANERLSSKKESTKIKRQDIPLCFFPKNYQGYYVTNITDVSYGQTILLKRDTVSTWPNDIINLQVDIIYETSQRLHFKVEKLIKIWLYFKNNFIVVSFPIL